MAFMGLAGGVALGSTVSSIAGSLLGPVTDRASYTAYRLDQTRLPDPHSIIVAYYAGLIHENVARDNLKFLGVDWTPHKNEAGLDSWRSLWYSAGRAMLKVPSVEMALQGYVRGLLTNDEYLKVAKRAGAANEQWEWVKNLSYAVPSAELAASAFAREAITPAEYGDMIKRAGGRPSLWGDAIQAYYSTPSVQEALVLRNRNIIDDAEMDSLLRRNSLGRQRDREIVSRLRYTIPTISDLITMQVREAFAPAIANKLGLYDESPKDIIPYFEAQGLNWPTGIFGNVDGVDRMLNWPDMYWAMHWRPFSPEQVFRMWHVLRPERIRRYTDRGLDVAEFKLKDVQDWLKIQDYPPKVRDYLAAIAFSPLRLIDIRNALQTGVAGDAYARENGLDPPANQAEKNRLGRLWAIEQFKDRGVHPNDAEVQADLAFAALRKKLFAPADAFNRGAIGTFIKGTLELYRTGMISRPNAVIALTMPELEPAAIGIQLDAIDREIRIRNNKQALKLIERRFKDGVTSDNEAIAEMDQMGIVAERQLDYLNLWRSQRSHKYRINTTSQILEWARDGFLNPQDATTRLRNLGWSEPDIMIHLADIQLDVNQNQARQLQAAARNQKAQARELERLATLAQQTLDRARADLRRISPVSKLQKWLRQSVISEAFFQSRMAAMGYPAQEILLHLAEAYIDGPANGQTQTQTPPAPNPP